MSIECQKSVRVLVLVCVRVRVRVRVRATSYTVPVACYVFYLQNSVLQCSKCNPNKF